MLCPFCKKGKMKVIKDKMPIDNIEFEAFECEKCKESILDMNQLNTLADKYKEWRKTKKTSFAKWGNSLAIRIPDELVK
mgnify:FL=1